MFERNVSINSSWKLAEFRDGNGFDRWSWSTTSMSGVPMFPASSVEKPEFFQNCVR